MPPPQATEALYSTLQRYQLLLVFGARGLWRQMTPDFDRSWSGIAPSLEMLAAGAQLAAATAAVAYVPEVLAETGQQDAPEARVRPEAFAGVASDGRSLGGLLEGAVVAAKQAMRSGAASDAALVGGQKWLEMALQTAVADAARDAAATEVAVRQNLGWVRMVNPPCCRDCAVLAGKWFSWEADFDRHPNCFPEGVLASGPGHSAAARRWYDGELVVLATASGQQLPLTGNHPVLTSRGWVPANLLEEGDHVVRGTAPEGARGLVVPDHHEMPSRIEDVWRALSVRGLRRVPSTPEDFHGDGQYGHVDVVGANGALSDRRIGQAFGEQVVEPEFAGRSRVTERLVRKGAAELVDLRNAAQSHGAVRFGGLGLALLGSHLSGPDRPRLTAAAALHASREEALGYRSAADAVLARERKFARPGLVSLDDLGHRQDPLVARWDAPGDAFSVETSAGYASRGLDLLNRLSGQVQLDRVVELRRVQWSGHVYSLTSVEGWHSANSLIVSNCDCTVIPSAENMADDFTTDPRLLLQRGLVKGVTKDQQARLDGGADPVKVLNESRDRWRVRQATERATKGPVDRLGRSRPPGWVGGGTGTTPLPPRSPAAFMDFLKADVDARNASRTDVVAAMRDAGLVT